MRKLFKIILDINSNIYLLTKNVHKCCYELICIVI